jgi:hypothetical protein
MKQFIVRVRRAPAWPRFRFLTNCDQQIKTPPEKLGGVFICWWSRRELNPRPQALHRPLYILRVHYLISPRRRQWSGCYSASHLNLTLQQVARGKAILVNDSAVNLYCYKFT